MNEVMASQRRKQAIENGELVDVSHEAKEAGIDLPIALTKCVWEGCVALPEGADTREAKGRLRFLLWILGTALQRRPTGGTFRFKFPVMVYHESPQLVDLEAGIRSLHDDSRGFMIVVFRG